MPKPGEKPAVKNEEDLQEEDESPDDSETENEGDDDSDEETDDSGDGASKDDDDDEEDADGEEGEEEEVESFMDPKDVPPQLKAAWTKMHGSFVRAMQEAAKVRVSADALTELAKLPQFQALIADLRADRPYGYSSDFNRPETATKKPAADGGDDTDAEAASNGALSRKDIESLVSSVVEAVVSKKIAPLENVAATTMLETFKRTHPDFEHYQDEIALLRRRYPTMPLDEAYDIASAKAGGGKKAKIAAAEAVRMAKKGTKALKNKNLRTEGSHSAGSSGLSPKSQKSIRESIEAALDQQGV